MHDSERYDDAVVRLAVCGYDVLPDERGYIVQHVTDSQDVSRMSNLDELIEMMELMEWAEKRRSAQVRLLE